MNTPEFLVWAIEYRCPIRGFQDGSNPERTERHLRAARAYGDALREGRVFEGLCVDPPQAFRIEDALEIYGGRQAVEQQCSPCPVNSLRGGLAGCYGVLPINDDLRRAVGRSERLDELFSRTNPRWYGLWMGSGLSGEQLSYLIEVFESPEVAALHQREVDELCEGLRAALRSNVPLHATLYPAGRVEGPWWRLVEHCPKCKAAWSDPKTGECHTCGYVGHPAPDKKRHARGRRPFAPLTQLLGEQAAEFLVRYEASRTQP
jgi:hypothetical protein